MEDMLEEEELEDAMDEYLLEEDMMDEEEMEEMMTMPPPYSPIVGEDDVDEGFNWFGLGHKHPHKTSHKNPRFLQEVKSYLKEKAGSECECNDGTTSIECCDDPDHKPGERSRKQGKMQEQRLPEGCEQMLPANNPDCVKCQAGSIGSYDPNITGPNCECCEDEGTGTGDDPTDPFDKPCNTCCCEEAMEGGRRTGRCVKGTTMMPAASPCDCASYGMIDDPDCKVPGGTGTGTPTQGLSVSERLDEVHRLKKLAGLSEKK